MRFSSYLTASAFAALASAQTFTDCDPTKKTCPNNPAMAASFQTDFKAGKDAVKGWKQTAGSLNYVAGGAEFTVAKKGDAPTIQTETYLHFGYIEVKMKAAPGAGIVSSIVLQSDDLDEVDWEFIGSVGNKVQMNYFGKGNTTTYDRMIEGDVANAQEAHTYALNWTAEALTWIIDNNPVRTLNFGDANGGKTYPQTPSNVRIGIWAGGDSENEGTRQWAGGPPNYAQAPFTMTVESVKITNYSPGTEYKWTDQSGSYQSIEVIGAGNKEGNPQNSAIIEPSATGTGAGLGSEVNHPTATGGAGAPASSPCSEGETPTPTPTPAPSTTPCSEGENTPLPTPSPSAPYTNGTAPPEETPCDCSGILTITVTGNPPPPETTAQVPPPPETTAAVPPPPESSAPVVPPAPPANSTVPAPPVSSPCSTEAPVSPPAPPVTEPASSAPPAPTSPGIVTDTNPVPSVPYPTNPTGAIPTPSGNASGTPPAEQFPGAASHNTAGALVGLVLGAAMMLAL